MRLSIAFFLLFSFLTFCVEGQKLPSGKKETDQDRRELIGRVHYVRIQRKLIKTTDDKGFEGGWIPSLTIYNRAGFVQKFTAYDDNGNLDYETVSKFDRAGNKKQELTLDKNNKFRGKHLMSYDRYSNQIELKAYDNYNKSMSMWLKSSYNRKGYAIRYTYLSREGKVLSFNKNIYNRDGKIKEEFSFDKNGKLQSRSKYFYHKKNEELWIAENQGIFIRRSLKLIDRKGNITEIAYDQNGKPWYKATNSYRRDAKGNWIKEICSEWEGENGVLVYKRTKLTKRTIIYSRWV